nr:MalY/PatB family protein [Tissierella sp.]
MKYNFDNIIKRKGTDSRKWNNLTEDYGSEDLLPMWVADMDFQSPPEVIDALKERVEHGIFGYPIIGDSVYDAIINWAKNRYDWDIKKEWIIFTPGVVVGLNIAIENIGEKGDNVIVQTPVYPPFFRILENNKRELNANPIKFDGENFVMDFENLENTIDEKTNVMMLCNPHNPVGRSWSKEDLTRLGDVCIKNDITIISDEIHCDLTLEGTKHVPIASISPELAKRTITLMSPGKSFNVAGLFTSIAIISNDELRDMMVNSLEKNEIDKVSTFGAAGLEAAYSKGANWLNEVLVYIEANMDFAIEYFNKNIPEIKLIKPEATFLLWLDFKSLNKSADEINEALLKTGKVVLNDGRPYGEGGEGYFRLNVACPRETLEEGLARIKRSVDSLR